MLSDFFDFIGDGRDKIEKVRNLRSIETNWVHEESNDVWQYRGVNMQLIGGVYVTRSKLCRSRKSFQHHGFYTKRLQK